MSELYDECHRLFIYDPETGLLARKIDVGKKVKKGMAVGFLLKGYLIVCINYKRYSAHRLIWLMVTGSLPKESIDHINGIKHDNRLVNLREATHHENMRNACKSKNNTTGFKGVSRSGSKKNPYMAKIEYLGKYIYLGLFPTPELAYQIYCTKAKELHGDFANFG